MGSPIRGVGGGEERGGGGDVDRDSRRMRRMRRMRGRRGSLLTVFGVSAIRWPPMVTIPPLGR